MGPRHVLLCLTCGNRPIPEHNPAPSVSFPIIYGLRLLQGLLQSPSFPSLNPLTNRWVPEEEKGKFVSFTRLGGVVGSIIIFPLADIIIDNFSWVWVFYSSAILTLVWAALWFAFAYDLPEIDPFISDVERKLITGQRSYNPSQKSDDDQTPLVPLLCDIIKTPAVWVNMIGDLANNFGSYVLLVESPAFFRGLLPVGENAETLGYICAAPLLSYTLYGFAAGALSDWLLAHTNISRLKLQKVFTGLAFLLPACGMIAMSFLATPDLQWVCIALLVFTFAFQGGTDPGYIQNILGLAPNRCGTVYGLTNGFGNISGYFVPEIKRHLVSDETSISEWRWLFVLTAIIYCIFIIIFLVGASGNVQTFNYKSYKGVNTATYFTRYQFLQFPVQPDSTPIENIESQPCQDDIGRQKN